MPRCRSAIALGWHPDVPVTPAEAPGLHTRCMKEEGDHTEHGGHGLPQFSYQTWSWFDSDRRTYLTDRDDTRAWEVEGELTVTPQERERANEILRQFARQQGIDPGAFGIERR